MGFGTKSKTSGVIAEINRKAQVAQIIDDFIEREAVFASYAQEFGTKSQTRRVIEGFDEQDAADREAVFAQYKAEFGTKSHTMQTIHADRLLAEQAVWEADESNRSPLFMTVCC